MEKEQYYQLLKDYLHLVALYLNKKVATDFKIDDSNIGFFVNLSKKNSLLALSYKVVKDTKVDIKPEYLKKLEEYYLSNVRKCVLFEEERKELYSFLKENNIAYLPLKGLVLKDYYYDQYTREFADNDILFDDKGSKKIKTFFVNRGYKVELYGNTNHDVYLKPPLFNFEMHRLLFDEADTSEKIFNWYSKERTNRILFNEENDSLENPNNFYVYFTAHTFKHFSSVGCGLRTLVDYYLFIKQNPSLDYKYIYAQLKQMDLVEFSDQISSLATKVFDEKKLNENEKQMLLSIASVGTFGTLENSVVNGVKKKGKFRYLMSRIFPPVSIYRYIFPWAYKYKILVPLAWVLRCFKILFSNPKGAAKELKMISKSDVDKEK